MSDTLHTDALDPDDMRGAVRDFPQHLETGWDRGEAVESFGLDAADLDGVVVCGMGGSAIGGDLVRGFVEPSAPIPFVVNRGYSLPGWVGEKTLVVVSTYSGGTEETLSSFDDARQRGARCLVVTSGGEALEQAKADGVDHVVIPGGLQPRAALGYSLGVVLRIARTLGLAELTDDAMARALDQARQRAQDHDRDQDGNPARDLSADWVEALPVVYTGVGLLEAVGMRWQTQINENAKHPAVGNVLPELDHNEIMGFESGPEGVLSPHAGRRPARRRRPPPGRQAVPGHQRTRRRRRWRLDRDRGRRLHAPGPDAVADPARRRRQLLAGDAEGGGPDAGRDHPATQKDAGLTAPWPGRARFAVHQRTAQPCRAAGGGYADGRPKPRTLAPCVGLQRWGSRTGIEAADVG